MKTTKRILSLLLALAILCSMFLISSSAASTTAFDILSSSRYAKTYTLSSSGTTIPYTSQSLSTRGTVTYGASSTSYIDNRTDELYLIDVGVSNGKYWAYVSYPTSSKRVYAYIPLSAISDNNASHAKTTSTGTFNCSLRSSTSVSSSYYVSKGDTVYLVATSGSKYQILYPTSGSAYRLAWCNASDYNKYCAGGTTSSPSLSDAEQQIYDRLQNMANGSYGNGVYRTGTRYTGEYANEQCKGFAKKVHMILFGYNIGSTKSKPNNYQISISSSNTSLVGSISDLSSASNTTVSNLFSKARAGDFIQVRRSHGGSHSMIFLSSDANGVTVFECNVDGKNGIQIATYSWSKFLSSNAAVSVYTAKDYRLH